MPTRVGDTAQGENWLRQAREIFQLIGSAEVADVTAEMNGLTPGKPAAMNVPDSATDQHNNDKG
jgi:hypothetical protein